MTISEMSPQKLSIGFVRRGYSASGGAEAYLKRLGRGVVDLGHEAQLITSDDWPSNEWRSGSIHHLRARSTIAFAGDGVHRAWLQRRRKLELPLQQFVRGFNRKHRDLLLLEKSLLGERGASRVIANSEMVKNEIVDLYSYPADQIDIVRNGVPLEKFRFDPELREKAREDLKLKPDQIILLFAGSGWERKGLRFAVKAMAL